MGKKAENPGPPERGEKTVKATISQIETVFTEWEKAYSEHSERFEEKKTDPETYGKECAAFFVELLEDIKMEEEFAAQIPK